MDLTERKAELKDEENEMDDLGHCLSPFITAVPESTGSPGKSLTFLSKYSQVIHLIE